MVSHAVLEPEIFGHERRPFPATIAKRCVAPDPEPGDGLASSRRVMKMVPACRAAVPVDRPLPQDGRCRPKKLSIGLRNIPESWRRSPHSSPSPPSPALSAKHSILKRPLEFSSGNTVPQQMIREEWRRGFRANFSVIPIVTTGSCVPGPITVIQEEQLLRAFPSPCRRGASDRDPFGGRQKVRAFHPDVALLSSLCTSG